jgi:hypothetical protein
MKAPPKNSRVRTSTNGKWQLQPKQPPAATQVVQARPQVSPGDASHDSAREAVRRMADKYITRDGRVLLPNRPSR